LEHHAKEAQNAQAVTELSRRLAAAIPRHPTLARADAIAAMPARPSSTFHLPVQLVRQIGTEIGRPVGLNLTKAEHPKLRTLPIEQKLAALAGVFSLGESVRGKSVLIVDDLYQSGVTAWSLAKFLKAQGAREVYAPACVKSWRDTDNV
jgi:predicted amidophosphoribosyltransferase